MTITIGADPELFFRSGNTLVPAVGLIPGTKAKPHKVENGAIQVDGTAFEFNINPSSSENEFINNLVSVMETLDKRVKEKYPDGRFLFIPIVRYDKTVFEKLPPVAKELGCDPDFSAYTLTPNRIPEPPEGVRTASGHVHIGFTTGADVWSEEHFERCASLVKQLDAALGFPAQYFSPLNPERQKYYGNFGAFRPKPYGLEYRVLDNTWLSHNELMKWVYRQTRWAVQLWEEGVDITLWSDMPRDPEEMIYRLIAEGAPDFPFEVANRTRDVALRETDEAKNG